VFEKIRDGIWAYNGLFVLIDGWQETNDRRQVFKFRLQFLDEITLEPTTAAISIDLEHDRVIPSAVKVEVWKRDKGRCVECGAKDNLHFDHILIHKEGHRKVQIIFRSFVLDTIFRRGTTSNSWDGYSFLPRAHRLRRSH
jgi:hypothetical protein